MLQYNYKDLLAINVELLFDARNKGGVPNDIQLLMGKILLTLSDSDRGVLKVDAEAEYERRLEHIKMDRINTVRKELPNSFIDFE